jgi:hypothetical protein
MKLMVMEEDEVVMFELPTGEKFVVTKQGWEARKQVWEKALKTAVVIKPADLPKDAKIAEFP